MSILSLVDLFFYVFSVYLSHFLSSQTHLYLSQSLIFHALLIVSISCNKREIQNRNPLCHYLSGDTVSSMSQSPSYLASPLADTNPVCGAVTKLHGFQSCMCFARFQVHVEGRWQRQARDNWTKLGGKTYGFFLSFLIHIFRKRLFAKMCVNSVWSGCCITRTWKPVIPVMNLHHASLHLLL